VRISIQSRYGDFRLEVPVTQMVDLDKALTEAKKTMHRFLNELAHSNDKWNSERISIPGPSSRLPPMPRKQKSAPESEPTEDVAWSIIRITGTPAKAGWPRLCSRTRLPRLHGK